MSATTIKVSVIFSPWAERITTNGEWELRQRGAFVYFRKARRFIPYHPGTWRSSL